MKNGFQRGIRERLGGNCHISSKGKRFIWGVLVARILQEGGPKFKGGIESRRVESRPERTRDRVEPISFAKHRLQSNSVLQSDSVLSTQSSQALDDTKQTQKVSNFLARSIGAYLLSCRFLQQVSVCLRNQLTLYQHDGAIRSV